MKSTSIQATKPPVFRTKDTSMLPPRKVMRRGTLELQAAVEAGDIELSLPKQDWMPWISVDPNISARNMLGSDYMTSMHSIWDHARSVRDSTNSAAGFAVPKSCLTPTLPLCISDDNYDTYPSPQSTELSSRSQNNLNEKSSSQISSEVKEERRAMDGQQNLEFSLEAENRFPRFGDIIGHAAVKLRLEEVLLPLALPQDLAASILVGVRSLSPSILLFGPPGCGKTQLAKAIAGEAEAAFLTAGPSDILSKFVGESESAIRSLFDRAHDQARYVESRCAVVFFDEIDALGQSRGASHNSQDSTGDPSSRRILAELLIQLNRSPIKPEKAQVHSAMQHNDEHFNSETESQIILDNGKGDARIIVVAATNRPEDCDPALLRRFSVRAVVSAPSRRDRTKMLRRFLQGIDNTLSAEELDSISLETEGWSGSDLESLTREAAMAPVREGIRLAALLKRRNAMSRQKSDTSTNRRPGGNRPIGRDGSRKDLLQQFSKLRPVCIQDFRDAIAFWAYNQANANPRCWLDYEERAPLEIHNIHYDSSSDEEEY